MTIDEVYAFYGSGYRLRKATGLSQSNFHNWKIRGYIPIATQMKIERLSEGALRADLSHCKKEEEMPGEYSRRDS